MTLFAAEDQAIRAAFHTFETTTLWIIVVLSLLALAFAAYLRREVLAAPEGTDKMKEIAQAIQEGSAAYLNRQLRTVAAFVAVLAVAIFFILPVPGGHVHSELDDPAGSLDRLRGRRGLLGHHRLLGHVARRARQRARRQRGARVGTPLGHDAGVSDRRRGRDVHRRPGSAGRDPVRAAVQAGRAGRPGGARLRRRAAGDVHAGRRRDLHQGRGRGGRPGRESRAGHPRGRPAQRRGDRRQRGRQRGRLRGHGRRPVRVLPGRRWPPRSSWGPRRTGRRRAACCSP